MFETHKSSSQETPNEGPVSEETVQLLGLVDSPPSIYGNFNQQHVPNLATQL